MIFSPNNFFCKSHVLTIQRVLSCPLLFLDHILDMSPIYSWDNLQDDGIWVLARHDRFYSFSTSVQKLPSHVMQYTILEDSSFSDHRPVSLLLNNLSTSPHVAPLGRLTLEFCKKPETFKRHYWRHLLPSPWLRHKLNRGGRAAQSWP